MNTCTIKQKLVYTCTFLLKRMSLGEMGALLMFHTSICTNNYQILMFYLVNAYLGNIGLREIRKY